MKKRVLVLMWVFATVLSVSAQPPRTLTVFAAASLTDSFRAIAAAFQAENPDVEVVFNFAGSATLAVQLTEGAPADVFASANVRQMEVAIAAGRIVTPAYIFIRNQLIIILPADNPARITSLSDLADPGVKLVVAAPDVPVRVYTDTMLDLMEADPDYGSDYRQAVLDNIVSEEENVRQVVAKIVLGEADAGVVYQSDVTPDVADEVATIPVPDAYNTIAEYPLARISDSAQPELAQAFVGFVLSEAGQDILVQWSFVGRCEVSAEPIAEAEATPAVLPEAEATPEPVTEPLIVKAACP